ncbi:N-fatty-acyl-amino acid synthase/hydrolase PM20D1 isoform X2 [Ornithorhynchus anatinus]|uniref:N-fatty-acyl-amino acid synthase/hydrolase PM20D1 n=1 Tax=Ornithorhynchus anatinus TaxID=9258 RepID=F6ZI18_ORNAN|nr:N-fatty-acyl-amino acid synthase/hydrolase PM20D1 isoform X2 [Ornithorhynchus anatinus]
MAGRGPLSCLSVLLGALLSVLLLRTATFPGPPEPRGWRPAGDPNIPARLGGDQRARMETLLREALRIPTVSFGPDQLNTTALKEFSQFIRKAFPTLFSTSFIQYEVVGEYSHLFTVRGSDPRLQPYMLLAHLDVVPASDEGWDVPPFSGLERDGFIHGRGALDNKNSVMGILQALELLLEQNYVPRRSFYVSLGHDEEVSGKRGAVQISSLLQSRGVTLAFIVDEGSFILDGFIPNLQGPIAQIAVSEKGAMNLELRVDAPPGHSSAPPKESSIGILAGALSRLEQTPMPNLFGNSLVENMFEQLATQFGFPLNIVMTNLWLFKPILSRVLEWNPITNALVRTTIALTMFNAGVKVNVIPPTAQAWVNLRIHPSQNVHQVLESIQNTVADERVQIHVHNAFDPLPISPYDDQAFGYQLLRKTIRDVFPEVISIIPGICIGNTDSRHYANLTTGIYRFNPAIIKPQDFRSIHGFNERISIQQYEKQLSRGNLR